MEKLTGEFKFNNCTHRSDEEETVTIHRCKCQGGDYRDSGFKCHKKGIFKIVSQICEHCDSFAQKEIN